MSEACGWKLAFSDLLVSCSLGKDETMRPSLRQCPGYVLDSADDVIETCALHSSSNVVNIWTRGRISIQLLTIFKNV